jgi:hypothetical protein
VLITVLCWEVDNSLLLAVVTLPLLDCDISCCNELLQHLNGYSSLLAFPSFCWFVLSDCTTGHGADSWQESTFLFRSQAVGGGATHGTDVHMPK